MLLENETLAPIAEEVLKDSCFELIQNLDEESVAKIEEYVGLLNEKKTKKSLENEISEALSPILERNTILYGSFLYETQPIEENATSEKPVLVTIRENSSAEYVANVFTEQSDDKKSKWKTAGKIGAGLGAAGAAGAAGLAAAGEGDIGAGVEKAKEATSDVVGKFKNKISGGSTDGGSGVEVEPGTGRVSVTNTGNEAKRLAPRNYGSGVKKLNPLNPLNKI